MPSSWVIFISDGIVAVSWPRGPLTKTSLPLMVTRTFAGSVIGILPIRDIFPPQNRHGFGYAFPVLPGRALNSLGQKLLKRCFCFFLAETAFESLAQTFYLRAAA